MHRLEVPRTLASATDPAWLAAMLAPADGAAVADIEIVEVIRNLATKVRFTATIGGVKEAFCIKGLFDPDEAAARSGITTVFETDFYDRIAPRLKVRVPECAAALIDREASLGVVIIRDLVAAGARFGTAFEPFTPDQAAASLEQLAGLHANGALVRETPWLRRRIAEFVDPGYVTTAGLQALLDGARGDSLTARTRDAALLQNALRELAARDGRRPQYLIHGDCHGGNIYWMPDGPGLIDWQMLQLGGWALDVAYHIAAVLPIDLAEREERRLLAHYLDVLRGLGGDAPSLDDAWDQYRQSVVYGFYLWAIAQRVDPAMINELLRRIGAAVERHDSYRLLDAESVVRQ